MSRWLQVENNGSVTVAEVQQARVLDELDIAQFGKELMALLEARDAPQVVLDMSKVVYMSSAGFGKLVQFDRKVKGAGGRWALCGIVPSLYEAFAMTRLNRCFRIVSDRSDAISWLQGASLGRILTTCTACPVYQCKGTVVATHNVAVCGPDAVEQWSGSCSMCAARIELEGLLPSGAKPGRATVQTISSGTYDNEHVILEPSNSIAIADRLHQFGRIRVMGRLDLFVAESVERMWYSLPPPRWIVLDLGQAVEVSAKGMRALADVRDSDPMKFRAVIVSPHLSVEHSIFPHAKELSAAVELLGELPKGNGQTLQALVTTYS